MRGALRARGGRRAGRARGRSPRSPGRSRARRPSASGCARSPRSPRRDEADALAARERLGAPARPRAPRVHARDAAAPPASCSSSSASKHDLQRHRARALRRLLLRLVLRPADLAADDRRRGRREADAAASRTPRSTASSPACRRRSATERVEPERRRGRGALHARVPRRGARGRRHGDDRHAAPRARPGRSGATSRRSSATRRRRSCRSSRAASRSASAPSAPRPSSSAGSSSATALSLSGKIDRIDLDPFSARGIVQDYKSGKSAHSAARDREGAAAPDPALHARPARPRRDRAARRRSTGRSPATRKPRGLLRDGRPRVAARLREERLPRRGGVLGPGREGARRRPPARGPHPHRRRRPRPARRRLPGLVRPLDDVPGEARVSRDAEPEQQAAVDARGDGLRLRGRGHRQDERARRALRRGGLRRGLDVDSMLVITYTEARRGRAARRGSARALVERGRPDLARQLDGAWISTIHGFCNRLLKTYPFAAGLDPRFRELDEPQARRPPRRGVRGGARASSAPARSRSGCACSRPTAAAGCGGCSPASTRRCARPGARSSSSSASRRDLAGADRGAARGRALPRRGRRRDRAAARERGARLLDAARARAARRSSCSTSPASAPRGERRRRYEEARRRVEQAALDELARARPRPAPGAARALRGRLRRRRRRASRRSTSRTSSSRARDLLRDTAGDPRARAAALPRRSWSTSSRTRTALQCELVDLLAPATTRSCSSSATSSSRSTASGTPTSRVFRERRAEAPQVLALTRNYRSRPEVLAAVNELFGAHFGDEFQPLAGLGRVPRPGLRARRSSCSSPTRRATPAAARTGAAAEAQAIARRVRELVDAGDGDAGRDRAPVRGRHRRRVVRGGAPRAGLPTYRATGRGYFGQQQVVDLLAYLRLLHNRYDDEALADRARVAVRRRLERRARADPPRGVAAAALRRDRAGAAAARSRPTTSGSCGRSSSATSGSSRASQRLSLERLCERIVAEHDYDLAVLAQWDGRRRYANLRKLARLARSYEELRGADVEGFVRFVREQEAVGATELEAVAEEEGADAVRLLTIHAAKGLEFKVVIVADAGRDRPRAVVRGDPRALRRPLRLPGRAPGDERAAATAFATTAVREARKERGGAEKLRLYYVAMTRAIDRLIVSGAIDPEKARRRDADRLGARAARRARRARERGRRAGRARARRRAAARAARPASRRAPSPRPSRAEAARRAEDGQLALFDELPAAAPAPRGARAARARAAAGAAAAPRAAALVQRARALRALLVPLLRRARRRDARARAPPARVPATAACRDRDRRRRAPAARGGRPRATRARPTSSRFARWYPTVDRRGARADPRLRRRRTARPTSRGGSPRSPGAGAERPFAFEHDGVLLRGRLDVLHRDGERALVVDYKTNLLGDASADEVVEAELPAPAARLRARVLPRRRERGRGRLPLPRARRTRVVSASFGRDDVPALEAELSEAIARDPGGPSSCRRRASSPAPAARRSTSSAPGPRLPRRRLRASRPRPLRPSGAELRRGGAAPRRAEARADRPDRRAAGGRARRRARSRSASRARSSCSSR